MEYAHLVSNPFALMLDPAAVILAIEKSERLSRLHSRICRPLDKVLGAPADDAAGEPDIVTVEGFEIEAS